jgi:hypothetical protein
MINQNKVPNPGSPEAIKSGCCCPVMDNNGDGIPTKDGIVFWYSGDCSIHGNQIG